MMATDEKIRMETVRRILTRSREEQQRGTATSLRRTTMREEWDGRPPEQLSARDRTQEDLATLEELIDEAEGLQGRG